MDQTPWLLVGRINYPSYDPHKKDEPVNMASTHFVCHMLSKSPTAAAKICSRTPKTGKIISNDCIAVSIEWPEEPKQHDECSLVDIGRKVRQF